MSVDQLCQTLCDPMNTWAHQASLSITNSRSLLKLMSIEMVMPSNHLILCCPPLLPPSVFSSIRVSSKESALHINQVAKVLEFQLQHLRVPLLLGHAQPFITPRLLLEIVLWYLLGVQWFRLSVSTAVGTDSIPGRRTKSLHAVWCSWGKKIERKRNNAVMNIFYINLNLCLYFWFSSVQSLRHVQFFVTPWTAARQASLFITNSQSSLKLMSIESVMPSNHLILCRPLLLPLSIFPSIRDFSNESALYIKWSKYWRFSFNISPSNEYSGLIPFRMD